MQSKKLWMESQATKAATGWVPGAAAACGAHVAALQGGASLKLNQYELETWNSKLNQLQSRRFNP